MFSPLEQFDAINIFQIFFRTPLFFNKIILDLSLFNIIVPLLIVLFFFSVITFLFNRNYYLVPKDHQYIFESLIIFIFNLVKQQIGVLGYPFFPLIFVLFIFILICNLLSLIPFGIALTSHIIVIL